MSPPVFVPLPAYRAYSEVGRGLTGHDVVATLERLRFDRGLPQRIYCDNGSEFVGAAMDLWAYTNGVVLDFSRRGKPTDNAAIESFNGRVRDECLNVHWFASLEDATTKIETWRQVVVRHQKLRGDSTPRRGAVWHDLRG